MEGLFLLVFVGAVGFAIWLLVFSKYGKGGLAAATSDDATLPTLDNESPPLSWGTEVRDITDATGQARQTFDIVKVGLPRAFPGELVAIPKSWLKNTEAAESVVALEGKLGEQWLVQASNADRAKRLLSSAALRAALEPLFVKSRTPYVEKNHLVIAAKYEPTGDERVMWEKTARAGAAAIRAELKALAKK